MGNDKRVTLSVTERQLTILIKGFALQLEATPPGQIDVVEYELSELLDNAMDEVK